MKTLRVVAIGGIGLLQLLSCGGDPPICPTGDCTLPGSTIIKWTFDHYPDWGFSSDTCIDMGADRVSVTATLASDPTVTTTMEAPCGEQQVVFVGLTDGTYSVAVTPVDVNGAPIVKAAIGAQLPAGTSEHSSDVTVNIPWDAWSAPPPDGTFLFRIQWGGASCETAMPSVKTQTLKLMSRGAVVQKLTDKNQKVDGTDPQACRMLGEPFAQYVEGVPFGPATITITGKDGAGDTRFERTFDTFVGATKNNPTLMFDVAAPPADAGVDGGTDAAAPLD